MESKIVRTPSKALGGVTKAEKILLKAHADKWIANAMRTDPVNHEALTASIKKLYAVGGLKEPIVVIVPSPIVMAFAGGFSAAILHSRKTGFGKLLATRSATDDATINATDSATRGVTHDGADDAIKDATNVATYAATRFVTHDATDTETRIALSVATRFAAHKVATDTETRIALSVATRDATDFATSAATEDATDFATRDATEDATSVATLVETGFATDSATRDAISTATKDATDVATRNATDAATDAATRGLTRGATIVATSFATSAATDVATSLATINATDAATSDATDFETYDATYVATLAATRFATDAATSDATRGAHLTQELPAKIALLAKKLGSDFDVSPKFMLQCAQSWWRTYQGGNMWSAWPSYLSAFRDVLGLRLPEYEKFEAWERCAIEGGFRFMHEDFCIVSDRPKTLLVDDRNRPHCATGPSHEWRDGWKLWHWHGVRISEDKKHIIEDPELITWQEIEAEDNAEIRRVMIKRYGAERYVTNSGAKIVQHLPVDHPVVGLRDAKLLVKQVQDDEPIAYIDLLNSTPEPDGTVKRYMLRVDPSAYDGMASIDCHAAAASTWRNADGSLTFQKYKDYACVAES